MNLDEYLKPYAPEIQTLFQELRVFVRSVAPDATGLIYDAYSAFGVNYSVTDQLKDGFCSVVAYSKHVNLGFNRGAELADPKNLLRGEGKTWRHLKVSSMDGLDQQSARALIAKARELSRRSCPPERAKEKYPSTYSRRFAVHRARFTRQRADLVRYRCLERGAAHGQMRESVAMLV